MRDDPTTPGDPRAARGLRRGLRPGIDQFPDRPAALHRHHQNLDPVLARPQPALPPLRASGPVTPGQRSSHRTRPRPHRHLLGLAPARPSQQFHPTQVRPTSAPSQRGQFRLTSPASSAAVALRAASSSSASSLGVLSMTRHRLAPGASSETARPDRPRSRAATRRSVSPLRPVNDLLAHCLRIRMGHLTSC
jgi:hypothetical protein